MVKESVILTHSACYHYSGVILAAEITAIRSCHYIEIFIAEVYMEKYL